MAAAVSHAATLRAVGGATLDAWQINKSPEWWRSSSFLWTEEPSPMLMSALPMLIWKFCAILVKIQDPRSGIRQVDPKVLAKNLKRLYLNSQGGKLVREARQRGSAGKGTFCQAWWPMFNSQGPCGGRKEQISIGCPLTSTSMLGMHTWTHK